jgi:hypothetical protein
MCIFGELTRLRQSLRIDREKLAWAAGFFDGEGTTFAKSDTDRPGYHQLSVSVPQAGDSTPLVLERFRDSVLGMGRIDPPGIDGAYRWRSRGFVDAQQTVILLWPYLGDVKRQQAAAAMRRVSAQFRSGTYRARPPKSKPVLIPHRHARASARSRLQRAWAAGFLDAEGCFGLVRAQSRVGGQPWYRMRASASQHGEIGQPAAVLRRLHRIVRVGRIERHGEPDDFKWVAEGLPAVEKVLDVVGPWLGSVKLNQARDATRAFTSQVRFKGGDYCKRGHRYDRRITTKAGRVRAYCNACARLMSRRIRAEHGIAPRRFKNAQRRYTH